MSKRREVMQITRGNLRTLIREMLAENVDYKRVGQLKTDLRNMLEKDFDVADRNVRYPYGRNRGDVRSTTRYTRKDGRPVTPSDTRVFDDLTDAQKGDYMAPLSGVYSYEIDDDGMTLVVKYYQHTAG